MSTKMVDRTLHIDENASHEQREALRDNILAQNGVMAAAFNKDTPHLLVVEYDPDILSAQTILEVVRKTGVHAEIAG